MTVPAKDHGYNWPANRLGAATGDDDPVMLQWREIALAKLISWDAWDIAIMLGLLPDPDVDG